MSEPANTNGTAISAGASEHAWGRPRTPPAFVTADVPGIGGTLKSIPEDFIVEEEPLEEPSGAGEFLWMLVEKRDLATTELARLIAKACGVARSSVSHAGLKDKRALTRQMIAVHLPETTSADAPEIEDERVGVLWADRHHERLRRGALTSNKFVIRVRGVEATAVIHAKRVLDVLARVGAPNRIGDQRFGSAGANHLVGRAMALGDEQAALDLLLGPSPWAPKTHERAREAYARGDLHAAFEGHSPAATTERRVLEALIDGAWPKRALKAMGADQALFLINAFQSAVFNEVLERRIADAAFARELDGDVSMPVGDGASSATGPIWGPGMERAGGEVARIEEDALAASGVEADQIAKAARRFNRTADGDRRALRTPLREVDVEGGMDESGGYVKVSFRLPPGAYATEVMREIMKPHRGEPDGASEAESAGDGDA